MKLQRAILALASLLACAAALAATVSERSPFTQGLWWERIRPGSGFEMFNAGGQVMVVWYTFDATGRPVWYTAQGPQQTLGASWPLLKHRWLRGAKAEPVVVGSLTVALANPETAQVGWQLEGQAGVTNIEPFVLSGTVNEVDRSGTWFDPGNPGWGLTLVEQGDFTGGALFTYSVDGEPTWAAGFERGKGSVELFVSSGACPWCAHRDATHLSAGRVSFDFQAESALTLRNRTSLPMAPGLAVDGARMTQLSRPASTRAADRQLASFDDASLLAYLRAGMASIPHYSMADYSPAPPGGAAFSPTNVQEEGVDEAGLVKSNGTHIYTYNYTSTAGGFTRLPQLRIARVEGNGAEVKAVGAVAIGTGERTPMAVAGLYLHGSNLVSVHGSRSVGGGFSAWDSGLHWSQGLTQVEILDIAAPEMPVTRWRADIDGYIIASRRVGGTLYVVSRYTPHLTGFVLPASGTQLAANDQVLAATSLEGFLPKVRTTDGAFGPLLRAADVYAAPQGARKPMADLVLVTAIDLDARRIRQAVGIAGVVDAIYASPANLYVASSRFELRTATGLLAKEPPSYRTEVHQFRLGSDAMSLVGTGSVEGWLNAIPEKAPLRMGEHQGKLRVVTTSINGWWPDNSNRVTVLEPSAVASGLLKTVSVLPNVQRPQPLGKPGEALHATRFAGDRLYAVTFRRVDPLYVVDLADVADPKIAAALEIPGFSDYLHPLPNGLLLGVGKDAIPSADFGDGGQGAWVQGLMVALYDVRDSGKPVELQRAVIGKRGTNSALLLNHHAFSALPVGAGRTAFALPARVHDGFPISGSGPAAEYPWHHSGLLRFELQGSSAADARLVQMKTLQSHNLQVLPVSYWEDPAVSEGRSVLFPQGSVYVGGGRFWHQDATGTATGPF